MKNIIICAVLCCMAITTLFSRTIEIHKKSGQNDKYNIIQENHIDSWLWGKKNTLKCSDPGTNKCEWTINPKTLPSMIGPNGSNPDWEDLYNHAISEITNGNNSGVYVSNIIINNDMWYRNVQWSGTDINNCDISIDIQLAQNP